MTDLTTPYSPPRCPSYSAELRGNGCSNCMTRLPVTACSGECGRSRIGVAPYTCWTCSMAGRGGEA